MENEQSPPAKVPFIVSTPRPPLHAWIPTVSRAQVVRCIAAELSRITGPQPRKRVQQCARRLEQFVWKNSLNEDEYRERAGQKVDCLRQQPSHDAGIKHDLNHPISTRAEDNCNSSEAYFARLREMRTLYRDEVALVYRELQRVNLITRYSIGLRYNVTEFYESLIKFKKIKYLLEQQPNEMAGIIPPSKRTLEYLDSVEEHIRQKVLPILKRLRRTYSTVLSPIFKCQRRRLRDK